MSFYKFYEKSARNFFFYLFISIFLSKCLQTDPTTIKTKHPQEKSVRITMALFIKFQGEGLEKDP